MKKDKDKIIITRRESEIIFDALADLEAMGPLGDDEEVDKKYNTRNTILKKLEKLLAEYDKHI